MFTSAYETRQKNLKASAVHQDSIYGSLFGGAIGDALGYPVKSASESEIFSIYGRNGITGYQLSNGIAKISSNTQLALFTANGLLSAVTAAGRYEYKHRPVARYVARSCREWLITQRPGMTAELMDVEREEAERKMEREAKSWSRPKPAIQSWLLDVPEMYARRDPEESVLLTLQNKDHMKYSYIEHKINDSRGCAGIVRVAPMALCFHAGDTPYNAIEKLDMEGAELAAITNGHSLGYMPAAVLVHIIRRIITSEGSMSLEDIILDAEHTISELFKEDPCLPELLHVMDLAMGLSKNDQSDLDNIHKIGEGWTAEEVLGIAIYCNLRYPGNFSKAVTVSVNHSGNSSAAGAVTGNIAGVLTGYESIESKWKDQLELSEILLQIAHDLCYAVQMNPYRYPFNCEWALRYIYVCDCQHSMHPGYTIFNNSNENHGFLSNSYECTFAENGVEFHSVKEYLAYRKEKECGKNFCGLWEKKRFGAVSNGLQLKFDQNPELKKSLLETGQTEIIYASPEELTFGAGLSETDLREIDFCMWPGQNDLGKKLMALRSKYRTAEED